jgi:hypothetical protein
VILSCGAETTWPFVVEDPWFSEEMAVDQDSTRQDLLCVFVKLVVYL